MTKVLHLSTFHLSGGAGIAASRLNDALNRNGVESRLLVGKTSRETENVTGLDTGFIGKAFFWQRFVTERLAFVPFERNPEVRYAFSPAVSGTDIARQNLVLEADIIHLHWVNFGFLSIDSIGRLLKLGKPVVWTMHDMWPFTGGCHHSGDCDHYMKSCGDCKFLKKPAKSDLSYRRLGRKKKEWTPATTLTAVACSRWLEERAGRSSLMKDIRLTNIPNPINTSVYKPSDKHAARIRLNLDPGKDYILFAAAKVSAAGKGFSYLKEALRMLIGSKPFIKKNLQLLVTGGGDTDEIGDLPITAHHLGYVGNEASMVDIYNAASLYVTPSLEENLPNTIMEALACGTPAVGFRTGGIPEMINHLENGYVADFKSPESLAEGIQWVLEQNANGRLSEAARTKVLGEYDEKLIAQRYIGLYEAVLKQ
ncbi:glycosyltransferase family 4 protein [Ravibacter arvi]|uniref:Glycosyltransferase family 4 protein n=1 Tax=Ravibacter arvi TaxID=2051041 RepID=A0ABP8LWB5_9BACT